MKESNAQEYQKSFLPKLDIQSASFIKSTWKGLKKNIMALISFWVIVVLGFVAISADFLAYDKPIFAVYQGNVYFPVFYDYLTSADLYRWDKELVLQDWRELELESSFWPLVRYLPTTHDTPNSHFTGPFDDQIPDKKNSHHILGTDELGRDVLSGLIHGTRISLTVGLVAVGISAIIGVILGGFAGYFGDSRLSVRRVNILFSTLGGIAGYFYAFFLRTEILVEGMNKGFFSLTSQFLISLFIFLGIILLFNLLAWPFKFVPILNKKVPIWIDLSLSRIVEIVVCLPTLLLVITIASIAKPSLYLVMVLIGLTSWTGIARLTRGEMLKVRHLEFVEAARSLGYSQFRIVMRHALPNSLAPVFVAIAFGIASAILTESALSFLGIGVPTETVTWGSLLNEGRKNPAAWWLAVFPGLAIFMTVTAFNLLGEGLRDALDPRLKE